MTKIRQSVIDDYNRVLDLIEEAKRLADKLDGPTAEHLYLSYVQMEAVMSRAAAAKAREDWLSRPLDGSVSDSVRP